MPVVLLVRHGQASFGADDYDVLSDLGREQSAVVAAELSRRQLRTPVAVSGSLRRQRDTASLALPDVPLQVDARWDEYDHLGLLQQYVSPGASHDGTSKGVQVLLDQALSSWVDDADGTWPDFTGGASAALSELASSLPSGADAVVFTSGGVIAAVCSALLGVGASAVVALNRVTVNGAITKVVVGRGGASLVSFNDHAHLPPELTTYR